MKVKITYLKTITVYIPPKKYDSKNENFPYHVVHEYAPPGSRIKEWSIVKQNKENKE